VRLPDDPQGGGPDYGHPSHHDDDAQVTMTDRNGAFASFGFYVIFN
jgi:hypothetical protein